MNFRSNGKLLITGEYLVLNGALALALPTKLGQGLHIEYIQSQHIYWNSYDANGKLWFWAKYCLKNLNIIESSSKKEAYLLANFIQCCKDLNSFFLRDIQGIKITTQLEFNREWGLGSSSTLINNIAQWASVDAFEILKRCFKGSGYDIACAKCNTPIFYQLKQDKPIYEKTQINEILKPYLYFVYLNKKRDSREAISNYLHKNTNLSSKISEISQITKDIPTSKSLSKFEQLLIKHEYILSRVLDIRSVQENLFKDYRLGVIKSLGAWGGDFIMATSKINPSEYFKYKGYDIIFKYSELIKD